MDALGATAQCHKGPSQDRAGHHTHQPPYFHIKPKRDYHALGSMLNPIGKGQRQAKQGRAKQQQIKSNSDATRVTCYPQGVSHVTLGRACHMLPRAKQSNGKKSRGKQSKAQQSTAKHKQSKSNSAATRVTCSPRAPVSHVTPGRTCHMLPYGVCDN